MELQLYAQDAPIRRQAYDDNSFCFHLGDFFRNSCRNAHSSSNTVLSHQSKWYDGHPNSETALMRYLVVNKKKFVHPSFFYYRLLCLVYILHQAHNIPLGILFWPRYFPFIDTYVLAWFKMYYLFFNFIFFISTVFYSFFYIFFYSFF